MLKNVILIHKGETRGDRDLFIGIILASLTYITSSLEFSQNKRNWREKIQIFFFFKPKFAVIVIVTFSSVYQCPIKVLRAPPNGEITFSLESNRRSPSIYPVNTRATLVCRNGTRLRGISTSVCTYAEVFQPSLGICIPGWGQEWKKCIKLFTCKWENLDKKLQKISLQR